MSQKRLTSLLRPVRLVVLRTRIAAARDSLFIASLACKNDDGKDYLVSANPNPGKER